ncbi:MAG: beta-lactamase family protein [Bacteroidales bacterium]|nr:beta-lactamase family protein [Clostridium sp.]MCM1202808.1 beta-lactamase family protein [Bacteroidales bacterium]
MNIPRQFYGVNYLSKLLNNFQDSDLSECPKLEFHQIEEVRELPLEKKDTAALGINAGELSGLLRRLVTDRFCALDGFAVAKGENLLFAGYRPPYSKEIPHITNSTCKTVTAIAVMFAVSEGLLKEEDLVLSFFPEYETMMTPKYVRQITVKHLLTMTSGTKCNETASVVETDWVKAFLLSDCQYEPGTRFVYNSMNTYMLAAILTKITGKSLMEYLKKRFFAPLGINHVKWELCPMGIERGGWGLHISLEGMLKIGMFLANNGKFHEKQLIPPSYIRKMKEETVSQDADAFATGYGYQLWHLPKGLYMLSGMYGQHVIIDEKNALIVATNAHSDKMFPDSPLVRNIVEYMTMHNLYKPDNPVRERMAYHKLMQEFQAFCNGWQLPKPSGELPFLLYSMKQEKIKAADGERVRNELSLFDGKRLHIDQASVKLFPYMLQGMYQCPPFTVTDIAFKKQENGLKLCFYRERSKKEDAKREHLIMDAGYGEYLHQVIAIGEDKRELAVKAYMAEDEENNPVVMLDIVFPAAGFSRLIKFFLLGENIGIECQEYPDMRAIVEQVIFGEAVIAGNTIDLTNKLPESIRVYMEHKVEPRVHGYFAKSGKK